MNFLNNGELWTRARAHISQWLFSKGAPVTVQCTSNGKRKNGGEGGGKGGGDYWVKWEYFRKKSVVKRSRLGWATPG